MSSMTREEAEKRLDELRGELSKVEEQWAADMVQKLNQSFDTYREPAKQVGLSSSELNSGSRDLKQQATREAAEGVTEDKPSRKSRSAKKKRAAAARRGQPKVKTSARGGRHHATV